MSKPESEMTEKLAAHIAALWIDGYRPEATAVIDANLAAAHAKGKAEGLEEAEVRCHYVLKHQNFDEAELNDYEQGFTHACELCEKTIRDLQTEAPRDSAAAVGD